MLSSSSSSSAGARRANGEAREAADRARTRQESSRFDATTIVWPFGLTATSSGLLRTAWPAFWPLEPPDSAKQSLKVSAPVEMLRAKVEIESSEFAVR